MAAMKITLDAALRARDVSRPTPAQEALAELSLADLPARPRQQVEQEARPDQPAAAGRGARQQGRRPGRRAGRPGPALPVRGPGAAPNQPGQPSAGKNSADKDTAQEDRAREDTAGQNAAIQNARPHAQAGRKRARPRVRRRYGLGQHPDQGSGGSSPELS